MPGVTIGGLPMEQVADGSHEHCTLGAMDVAAWKVQQRNKDVGSYDMMYASAIVQELIMAEAGSDIPSWNDNPERTEDEIHEAIRQSQKKIANLEE